MMVSSAPAYSAEVILATDWSVASVCDDYGMAFVCVLRVCVMIMEWLLYVCLHVCVMIMVW